ncbi:MAG: PepSY domain-containing protein, partial [Allosphingosinicella sp.]
MAQSTVFRLRSLWLQVHKWIGLLLAVLIIPISLTGSALVWHDWLDETLHPGRYAVSGAPALT